jgi:putative oxidoreductase
MLKNEAWGLFLFRCSLAVLLLLHGLHRISYPVSVQLLAVELAEQGLPAGLAYGVYLTEVVAPLMIFIGWYCRLGALLVCLSLVGTIILFHLPELQRLNHYGGWALELQGLYLAGALMLLLTGSGRLAARPD